MSDLIKDVIITLIVLAMAAGATRVADQAAPARAVEEAPAEGGAEGGAKKGAPAGASGENEGASAQKARIMAEQAEELAAEREKREAAAGEKSGKESGREAAAAAWEDLRRRSEAEVDKFIFAGDSRFVGMAENTAPEDVYVAKGSMGLKWFKESEPAIRREEGDNSALVIGFGVNDLGSADGYVEYVNGAQFSSRTYFLTVLPVDESYGTAVSNADVEAFNEKLKEGAEAYEVIDAYAYLQENGFSSFDGLHYTAETYKNVYDYLKRYIREDFERKAEEGHPSGA